MTRRTLIAGTPAYMAPEQRKGQLSVRSDVYALGLVLEELPKGLRNVPSELQEKIEKCLAIDPANRPASARDVLAAFPSGDLLDAAVAAGETPSPDLVAATEPSIRLSRRVASIGFGAVLIGMSIVVFTKERVSLEGRTPLPYSPDVLARHARRIAGVAATDHASWFAADPSIRFYYRQSPKPMASNDPDGRVTLEEPPPDLPGMVALSLTPDGAVRPVVHVEEKTPLSLTVYYALLIPLIIAGAFVARRNIRSWARRRARGAARRGVGLFLPHAVLDFRSASHAIVRRRVRNVQPRVREESHVRGRGVGGISGGRTVHPQAAAQDNHRMEAAARRSLERSHRRARHASRRRIRRRNGAPRRIAARRAGRGAVHDRDSCTLIAPVVAGAAFLFSDARDFLFALRSFSSAVVARDFAQDVDRVGGLGDGAGRPARASRAETARLHPRRCASVDSVCWFSTDTAF